jgi:hypothetical protein
MSGGIDGDAEADYLCLRSHMINGK